VDQPETEFTLFEVSEDLPTVQESALDDQTSDFDDSDYDLPPLTPSPTPSEPDSDEESNGRPSVTRLTGTYHIKPVVTGSRTVPDGNWKGSRKSSKDYRLPRTAEDLTGPPTEPHEFTAVKLSGDQKQIMKKFSEYLTLNWPSQRLNSELAESRYGAFVDPTGFWYALFKTEFKHYIDYIDAQHDSNRSQRVIYLYIFMGIPKLKYQ
jgi:hypothetical protein